MILSLERHLHHAEATINYYGHQLVGLGSDADLFTAIHSAAEKLEKQAVKARTKWRDTKRAPRKTASEAETGAAPRPAAEPEAEPEPPGLSRQPSPEAQAHDARRGDARDGQDAATTWSIATPRPIAFRVLVRRRDGHFDLVEG